MMPVLACVSGFQILIMLGVMLIGGLVLFAVSLIPYRHATRALAGPDKHLSPAQVFAATAALTLLWAGSLVGIVALLVHQLTTTSGVLICGAAGAILLMGLLVFNANAERPKIAHDARNARAQRGPFQIWAQDLFIALVCYGAGLAIVSKLFGPDASRISEFLPWAIYVLFAGTLGLIFAVDFCRRETGTQAASKRALVFVVVFTLFPVTLPLALMAWWRWRRTLELQAKLLKSAG